MNYTSTKVSSSDIPGETATHYDQFFGPLFFGPSAIEVAILLKYIALILFLAYNVS
ncbi:MAG: hypothetical protein ABI707_18940 [Ferruginibacter sp.]